MTKEQFTSLLPEQKEQFINSGGVFESAPLLEEVEKSTTLFMPSSEQAHDLSTQVNGVSDIESNTTYKGTPIPKSIVLPDNIVVNTPTSKTGEKKQTGPSDEITSSYLTEAKESTGATVYDSPSVSSIYIDGFDITDPIELLIMLDDEIASGIVKLHKWQRQFLLDFATGGKSDKTPFQALLRACNGSGKDKYILAPCAVWLCMRYRSARCVITSSSGVQLNNQTCAYIEQLCNSANRKFGPIWKCNYRYFECLATESPMICYATDEPGKAEGFHPLKFGAKMAILVSEDKTVPDEINVALNKCSGYTHRVHASTPGNAFGHFYDLCSIGVDRENVKNIGDIKPEDYIHYHVPYNICPHISESDLARCKRDLPGGEHGVAYKSQFLAEFGTTDEMVVIPYTYIWKAKNKKEDDWIPEQYNKAGLDLSDGGDETSLSVRNGNRLLKVIPFRFDNTEDTITFLNEKFRENSLTNPEALIFSDCGGMGKPMLDRMKRQGWSNIRYCDNRHKTTLPKTYRNWGSQSWFHFGTLLQQNEIILVDDPKLIKQLSTRYYKIIDGAIHQLLSKIEMRSRGYPSPDRADSCVLAFSDYKSTFVEEKDKGIDKPFEVEEEESKVVKSEFTLKSWAYNDKADVSRWNINNGQKNFDDLQDEILAFNRQQITNK